MRPPTLPAAQTLFRSGILAAPGLSRHTIGLHLVRANALVGTFVVVNPKFYGGGETTETLAERSPASSKVIV
jgi:hypothetical protein